MYGGISCACVRLGKGGLNFLPKNCFWAASLVTENNLGAQVLMYTINVETVLVDDEALLNIIRKKHCSAALLSVCVTVTENKLGAYIVGARLRKAGYN